MSGSASVGIDVGGGSVKIAVVEDGAVIGRGLEDRHGPLAVDLRRIVDRASRDHTIRSVGIGIAGLVDHPARRFVWGPHVSDGPVDVADVLDGHPTLVDNDGNLAAYAEATAGAAVGHSQVLAVSLGTGIGSGWVVDGEIQRGRGFAGEVGHMRLVEDGQRCACGRSGCWETLVSGWSLARSAEALEVGPDAVSLAQAASRGDERAARAISDAGRWLGVGIANLVLAMDPAVVVVAGGVAGLGDRILDPAREWIASAMPGSEHRPAVEIVASEFGRWAGATGAALAASALHEPTNEDRP